MSAIHNCKLKCQKDLNLSKSFLKSLFRYNVVICILNIGKIITFININLCKYENVFHIFLVIFYSTYITEWTLDTVEHSKH